MVIILAFFVGMLSFRMVNPALTDAPAETFIAENSAGHIKAISSVPHPMGTAEYERVRDYIVDELSRLGLTPKIQTTQVQDYYAKITEQRLVDIHNVYVEILHYCCDPVNDPYPVTPDNRDYETTLCHVCLLLFPYIRAGK